MRIVAVYYTHKPGGFCTRLYRLLTALGEAGHEVHYLTLDPPPLNAKNLHVSIIPFPLKTRAGALFFGLFLLWAPFYTAYKSVTIDPDRFVVFGAFYSTICCFGRILSGAPIILFMRSLVFKIDVITRKPWFVRILSNIVDRTGLIIASKVICMTKAMQVAVVKFAHISPNKCYILPNDLPATTKLTSIYSLLPKEVARKPVILTSGVLDERKNISLLLKGFKEAALNANLVIAGDGPLLEQLKQEASFLKLNDVYFVGWVDNLNSYLGDVALTVHPSLHEGMSNSILESWSANIPVIASDLLEMKDLITNENYLFNPHNSEDLALKMSFALTNLSEAQTETSKMALTLRFNWNQKALSIISNLS